MSEEKRTEQPSKSKCNIVRIEVYGMMYPNIVLVGARAPTILVLYVCM